MALLLVGWLTKAAEPGPPPATNNNVWLTLRPLLQTNSVKWAGNPSWERIVEGRQEQAAGRYFSRTVTHRVWSSGLEEAEQVNAQAMRRYRERWQKHLSAPLAVPAPVLYPSKVEEGVPLPPPAPTVPERKPRL